jgi:hypothetical protein
MRVRILGLSVTAILALQTTHAVAAGEPIMPLSQVHGGLHCTGKSVVQGTTISSFSVDVIDVVQSSGEGTRVLVRVSGPGVDSSGIAQGFSGSPVYCPDAHGTPLNIGALAETVGEYGNAVGLVTPIEQMLGEPVSPPSGAPRLAARARPLAGPLTVGGLSQALSTLVERAGRRAGRVVVAGPAKYTLGFPVQPLVPGASVSVGYATGAVSVGAIGTVTYRDGDTVYAFGHPLDGAGRRSMTLQDAYVYGVVNNPNVGLDTSYKLAAPGHTLGTVTSDTPNAVIGHVGGTPVLVPVHVAAHDLDTGRTLALNSEIADETDLGNPSGTSGTSLVGPLSIAQAATDIFNGAPANESGRMCLRVSLRESHAPLQFCNRYVGTGPPGGAGPPPALAGQAGSDASQALGLLDQAQFAALHVRRLDASIEARRGLAQASIVKATAARSVRPGHLLRVRLLLRRIRGPLAEVSFWLRVPRRTRGAVVATLGGPSASDQGQGPSGSATSLSNALALSLGAPQPPSAPPPKSLAELRTAFAAIARYDGLRVSFSRAGSARAGHATPVYRDPGLVITGKATIAFSVSRR